MSEEEKISSLHDDLEHPFSGKDIPEYDTERGYPNQYPDVGPRGERSIVNRLSQFGITQKDLASVGVESAFELSQEQFDALMIQAVRQQYDTLLPSVYGRWAKMEHPENQLAVVQRVARIYKSWGFRIVQKGDKLSVEEPNLLLSLEGAHFVRDLGDIDKIHDLGIRSVMVQYNNENALASNEGLTELGAQAVRKMIDQGIIIDLAHNNPNVRRDIFSVVESLGKGSLLAYTHGAESLDIAKDKQFAAYAEKRGLTSDEIKRLVGLGGIIGLGVTRPFYQNIEQMAEAIDRICQIEKGPQSLGLGSDFGGVAPSLEIGVANPAEVARLADVLAAKFNYPDALIKNILRNNIHHWVEDHQNKSI